MLSAEDNTNIAFINNLTLVTMHIFNLTATLQLFEEELLYALNCTINVKNHAQMTFIINSALAAGAFALISSELRFESHTILTFINNTAISLGGAFLVIGQTSPLKMPQT